MRAFVAIELSADVRERLREIVDELRRHVNGVRWVRPEAIHLTLKFLGEIDPATVPAVTEALDAAAAGMAPFVITVVGVRALPSVARPRVIYVAVEKGTAEVVALAERVESRLEALGFPREARGFTPHLTLGRCPEAGRRAEVARVLDRFTGRTAGDVPVTAISLIESVLKRTGAEYSCLARCPVGERRST